MKLKHFIIIIIVLSVIWQFSEKADAPLQFALFKQDPSSITIGWVGDMVPSEDDSYNQTAFSHTALELQKPDFMIGNLEGTFATQERESKCIYIESQCHAFRGQLSFAQSIKNAGFDMVSLVNNHSYDFGQDGLTDTEEELNRVGIPYISPTKPTASITIKGKKIGILGVSSTPPQETISDYDYIKEKISTLQKENDIVILIFHGGAEGKDKSIVTGEVEYQGSENRGNVELVAHTAIDAGADLVLGAGPHVLRKIEIYKGRPVAYSLGNFVTGKRLITGGNLSLSGIYTVTFSDNIPISYNLISIQLSDIGIPLIDFSNQSKAFIEALGK